MAGIHFTYNLPVHPSLPTASQEAKKGFSGRPLAPNWQEMKFLSKIYVQLKESILDPQGQAVLHALHNLEHTEVEDVRIGKYIELRLEAPDEPSARKEITKHCEGLLANPVIETYRFDLEKLA